MIVDQQEIIDQMQKYVLQKGKALNGASVRVYLADDGSGSIETHISFINKKEEEN